MYFRTGGGISIQQHQTRGMKGWGAGAVLLSMGGPGSGSSYDSPTQYADMTGRGMMSGRGYGGGLGESSALANLRVSKMKKPKNINFSF